MRTELTYGDTRFGPMIWINHGQWVGASLKHYGEYSAGEADLLRRLLRSTDVAMDLGANIGALTIPMAKACYQVLAVEPQPLHMDILKANVAMNGGCVEFYQCAIGAKVEKVWFDRVVPFRRPSPEGYQIEQQGDGRYPVNCTTIDELLHKRKVDLIKIDIESFETEALQGGRETLAKWRPILYAENDKYSRSLDLVKEIHHNRYRAYWHAVPLFRPDNFNANPTNVFFNTVSLNLLCLPEEQERFDVSQLHECTEAAPMWDGMCTPANMTMPGVMDVEAQGEERP